MTHPVEDKKLAFALAVMADAIVRDLQNGSCMAGAAVQEAWRMPTERIPVDEDGEMPTQELLDYCIYGNRAWKDSPQWLRGDV